MDSGFFFLVMTGWLLGLEYDQGPTLRPGVLSFNDPWHHTLMKSFMQGIAHIPPICSPVALWNLNWILLKLQAPLSEYIKDVSLSDLTFKVVFPTTSTRSLAALSCKEPFLIVHNKVFLWTRVSFLSKVVLSFYLIVLHPFVLLWNTFRMWFESLPCRDNQILLLCPWRDHAGGSLHLVPPFLEPQLQKSLDVV